MAIIDSQSSKNSAACTKQVGIDEEKPVKGHKRFYITGALGNLLDYFVVSANSCDGTIAAKYWNRMYNNNRHSSENNIIGIDFQIYKLLFRVFSEEVYCMIACELSTTRFTHVILLLIGFLPIFLYL